MIMVRVESSTNSTASKEKNKGQVFFSVRNKNVEEFQLFVFSCTGIHLLLFVSVAHVT